MNQYDLLKGLKKGGTFVLNCTWDEKQLAENLPGHMKRYLAQNNIDFYIINATSIAEEIGLGNRINMIMQAAFFKLAQVIPVEEAVKYLKEAVEDTYGKKGADIVRMNNAAIDKGVEEILRVNVPKEWADAKDEAEEEVELPEFIKDILVPMNRQEGDSLPVSAFVGREDGTFLQELLLMKTRCSNTCT